MSGTITYLPTITTGNPNHHYCVLLQNSSKLHWEPRSQRQAQSWAWFPKLENLLLHTRSQASTALGHKRIISNYPSKQRWQGTRRAQASNKESVNYIDNVEEEFTMQWMGVHTFRRATSPMLMLNTPSSQPGKWGHLWSAHFDLKYCNRR